jgi:hypothetical protein
MDNKINKTDSKRLTTQKYVKKAIYVNIRGKHQNTWKYVEKKVDNLLNTCFSDASKTVESDFYHRKIK